MYTINVSKLMPNGRYWHFFRIEKEIKVETKEVCVELKQRFPAPEWKISVSYQPNQFTDVTRELIA